MLERVGHEVLERGAPYFLKYIIFSGVLFKEGRRRLGNSYRQIIFLLEHCFLEVFGKNMAAEQTLKGKLAIVTGSSRST